MKNWINGVMIALGLLALGLCVKSGMTSISDNRRVVSVRGLCEREVQANKVTWPIVYKLVGNSLPDLYAQIENNDKEILDFLVANGIGSGEVTTGAPELNDNQANSYSSDAHYRYVITKVLTVSTDKVPLVNELTQRQGELLKKGIAIVPGDWNYPTHYEYTDLNSIKPEMIAEATRNAREAAQKFADDSGSKIGKIMEAHQGQFSIEDRDQYTPFIKTVRVVTYIDYQLN